MDKAHTYQISSWIRAALFLSSVPCIRIWVQGCDASPRDCKSKCKKKGTLRNYAYWRTRVLVAINKGSPKHTLCFLFLNLKEYSNHQSIDFQTIMSKLDFQTIVSKYGWKSVSGNERTEVSYYFTWKKYLVYFYFCLILAQRVIREF